MHKRIPAKELRIGMYLHELCGSWMQHPFWQSKFEIKDQATIKTILDSHIEEVVIDTDKGLDIEVPQPKVVKPVVSAPKPIPKPVEVSIEHEMEQATKICAKAKDAVSSMFHEVRMGKTMDATEAVAMVEEISASVMRNPSALISLARLKTKDDYTYMHSVAVCALMVSLSKQLGLDKETTRQAGVAGLLHDIGKMAIPTEVLDKPGKLTPEEFIIIQGHPMAGYNILLEAKGAPESALDVARHHHEKIGGGGYPDKLINGQISQLARMGAVCDVYDAITSNRPYKEGWDPSESLKRMATWQGHFDETIFQSFVKSIGIYPIGSLVRLESGRLAVVIDQSKKSLTTPKIKIFFSSKASRYIPPEVLDLSRVPCNDKIVSREDPKVWNFANLNELWASALD
ncbi:MAG: HD-GYP domain-containing protein [Methylophilaceae bacterium]